MKADKILTIGTILAILAANAIIITLFNKWSKEVLVEKSVKMLEVELGTLKAVKAPETGLALLISKTATKYDIPRPLLSCMLKIESTYNQAAISNTMDYGMAQINIQNIRRFKLDHAKVINSVQYNVDFGAKLLAHYQERYKDLEPRTWACRYNIGTGSLTRLGAACEAYLERLNGCLSAREYL